MPTKTTIVGNVQSASGEIATSGYVEFRLRPQSQGVLYRVAGPSGYIIAPQVVRLEINSSGNIQGELWGNDTISPANTAYDVTFAPDGVVTNIVRQLLISGGSYDLSTPVFATSVTLVPEYQTVPAQPLEANLLPIATDTFTVGQQGRRWSAGYFAQLFADSITTPIQSWTVSAFRIIQSLYVNLGTPGSAGLIKSLSDNLRGLWMDTGTQWYALNNGVANAAAFNFSTLRTASQNTTAMTAILAETNHVVIPPGRFGTITAASNATPIVVTSAAHGLVTGQAVVVKSVQGNTAANGSWLVTVLTTNTYSLDSSVGNGAYTSGGTWIECYPINTMVIADVKTIEFVNGAILYFPSGQSIDWRGAIKADCHQIIASRDILWVTPPVYFNANPRITQLNAAWWGAIGDDTTDNSIALQQFFNVCTNIANAQQRNGIEGIIPPGRYQYTTPLLIRADSIANQATYGMTIRGTVGGRSDVTSPLSSAMMNTNLHFTGTGVGVQIATTTVKALGGRISNIWFSGDVADVTSLVEAYVTCFEFNSCQFTSAGDAGLDCGLLINGYSNRIVNCGFVDCWNGLIVYRSNMTDVIDCIFEANRRDGCCIGNGSITLVHGCTLQDNVGKALNLDLQVYGIAAESNRGTVISGNYFEADPAVARDNSLFVRGIDFTYMVLDLVIRDNFFNTVGTTAPAHVELGTGINNVHFMANNFPAYGNDITPIRIKCTISGGNNPRQLLVDDMGIIKNISSNFSMTNRDYSHCGLTFTNVGSAGAVTFNLPAPVPGVTMRFNVQEAQSFVVNASTDGGTINNGAANSNTLTCNGAAGYGYLELRCLQTGSSPTRWSVISREGTWT